MIKYNNSTINACILGDTNIIKVYKNNVVCYYKITSSGGQVPCFAVVPDISQYLDTEFVDVFNRADKKWYKLNNLNAYEEYGVYGSGRTITYYQGKLTIDSGYEYIYSGSSWVNVGEVSGSTASLPDVPFVLNYNAKNYDSTTHTIPKTSGQLSDIDAIGYNNPSNIVDHSEDGYITISNSSMQIRRENQDIELFQRYNNYTGGTITIVSKAKTTDGNNLMTCRGDAYNWMYRQYPSYLTFHGSSETGSISSSNLSPNILSVRTYYNSGEYVYYNNWTDGTSTSPISFSYGDIITSSVPSCALFTGCYWSGCGWDDGEQWKGDFYWIYMSQNVLTDSQIQQVIDFNESGGGSTEYPMYYEEMSAPTDNVSFSSMTEAESYECPWVGMNATIDGDKYVFSGDSISGYEWVEKPSRLPSGYTEVEYIENVDYASLEINYKPNQDTRIITTMQASQVGEQQYGRFIGSGHWNCEDGQHGYQFDYEEYPIGVLHISWGAECGWDTSSGVYGDYDVHTYDWNKNAFYIDNVLVGSTTYANFQCEDNLGIFAAIMYNGRPPYIDTSESIEYLRGKLYDFKAYDDGVLAVELVPCIRDNDNKVGVYDIVNDVFYTSINSSYNFIAGNNV